MSASPSRQMNINLFMSPCGYQTGAWRLPGSRSDELLTLGFMSDIARQAERAKIDAVFVADALQVLEPAGRYPNPNELEPLTTLSALAATTQKIGLIGTASTSFTEPYNLARYFASLDHLSQGRAGWNIVTSFQGGENFTLGLPDHEERYRRAFEYMDVVTALWDSWQDDAIVNDKVQGHWAMTERIHKVNFKGDYYRVEGPLNIARSPQGWPVLVQAGSSDSGMNFAATYAEVVFTAQRTLTEARSFSADLKQRLAQKGRAPDKVKVLPGLMPIIGNTETEAAELAERIWDLVDVDVGLHALEPLIEGVALEELDLDEPIPSHHLRLPEHAEGNRSRYELFYNLATRDRYTLRQLVKVRAMGLGHLVVIGTAEQVADEMYAWFSQGACDGFNLQTPYLPGGLDAITEELIPVLQRRGLFRTEYEGSTLRDHLGLDRPPGRPATQR